MKLASFEAIVHALNGAEVRFIVVGGIAVIAHGYGRTTRDVDLVIQLKPDAPRILRTSTNSVCCTGERAVMTGKEEPDIDWSLMTWKGSRLQQHREFYALPFRRKLEVIEEFDDVARHFLEHRKSRGLPYIDPATGKLVKAVLRTP